MGLCDLVVICYYVVYLFWVVVVFVVLVDLGVGWVRFGLGLYWFVVLMVGFVWVLGVLLLLEWGGFV